MEAEREMMFKKSHKHLAAKTTGSEVLAAIEERLVELIPQRVKALGIDEPVYCLRIWYYGTDTGGDRVPSLMLGTAAARQAVLAAKGDAAPHYLWCADEVCTGAHTCEIDDPAVAALCRRWYDQPWGGRPETEELTPIREMAQRVAARLNGLRWSEYVPTTDDFVVFAADASHTFCNDYREMMASVPAERIALLRSRRMLGTVKWFTLSTVDEDED
jgi:hypothetical protein